MGINGINHLINASVAESHDEEDVPAALERTTQDGSGFDSEDELPPSDFDPEDDK